MGKYESRNGSVHTVVFGIPTWKLNLLWFSSKGLGLLANFHFKGNTLSLPHLEPLLPIDYVVATLLLLLWGLERIFIAWKSYFHKAIQVPTDWTLVTQCIRRIEPHQIEGHLMNTYNLPCIHTYNKIASK